jgi:ribosomal protein L24
MEQLEEFGNIKIGDKVKVCCGPFKNDVGKVCSIYRSNGNVRFVINRVGACRLDIHTAHVSKCECICESRLLFNRGCQCKEI